MAINANSSDKPVVSEGKLFTGLTNMKVIGINPNKAQLEAYGFRPQSEPQYTSIDNGVKKVRLDFYLEGIGPDGYQIRTKVAFFLEDQHRTNKEGTKAEWINDLGRTAWGTPTEPPKDFRWFDASTARLSKVGENELHLFIINWLNVQPGDEAKLEKFDALFDGNYAELLQLLAANPNNEVRVLLCIRDGKYQSVYGRYFDRATNNKTAYWNKHIEKQTKAGYPPKEDFQNDLAFKEWVEPTVIGDGTASNNTSDTGGPAVEEDPF